MNRQKTLLVLGVGLALFLYGGCSSNKPDASDESQAAGGKAGTTTKVAYSQQESGLAIRAVPFIFPDKRESAEAYYARVDAELALPGTDLNDLIAYFGFRYVTAQYLKEKSAEVLLDKTKFVGELGDSAAATYYAEHPIADDDVLASGFFAPKITDVAVDPALGIANYGWRKVVRLRAQADSGAAQHGLTDLYVLFNIFQPAAKVPDLAWSPYTDGDANNNQAIMIRGSGTGNPLYFSVFGKVTAGGAPRILALNASFDHRDPSIVTGDDYFIPGACADCHGGLIGPPDNRTPDYDHQKLNYLDSDHWFDRTYDDFKLIKDSNVNVLVDEKTLGLAKAFNVIRKLNAEIKVQNDKVKHGVPAKDFANRAVETWLALHASNDTHITPMDRPIPTNPPGAEWKDGPNRPDAELLPLLNQYCFRCHSSVKFHVFDRKAVAGRKTFIVGNPNANPPFVGYLDRAATDPFHMPQDRKLDAAVITKIKDLVKKL